MSKDAYSVGYDAETGQFFGRRRAHRHARFFLPHLHAGMDVLDCGCGQGTITTDFAGVVECGHVAGIDVAWSQIVQSKEHAAEQSAGIYFSQASLYHLPFDDKSFDAVFSHGVLEHLARPVDALREMGRVLKPDGILGIRHTDLGGFILEPAPAPLDQFVPLFMAVMRRNGGDPLAGRRQPKWLCEAGFERFLLGASFDCWTENAHDRHTNARFMASLISDSDMAEQIVHYGLADRAVLADMGRAFLQWGQNPEAFAAEAWGEAVAWK